MRWQQPAFFNRMHSGFVSSSSSCALNASSWYPWCGCRLHRLPLLAVFQLVFYELPGRSVYFLQHCIACDQAGAVCCLPAPVPRGLLGLEMPVCVKGGGGNTLCVRYVGAVAWQPCVEHCADACTLHVCNGQHTPHCTVGAIEWCSGSPCLNIA